MTTTPTLAAGTLGAVRALISQLNFAIPAKILLYDATTQQATVKPLIMDGYKGEDGERIVESLPAIAGVPVHFPGGGGARLTFPVGPGDLCMLIFSQKSLDTWLQGDGREVDPQDDRRSHMSDAVAYVGLHTFKGTTPAHATATVIEADDLRLGGSADAKTLATEEDLDNLKTAITNAVPGSADGGLQFKTQLLNALSSWPVGTSKTKAE